MPVSPNLKAYPAGYHRNPRRCRLLQIPFPTLSAEQQRETPARYCVHIPVRGPFYRNHPASSSGQHLTSPLVKRTRYVDSKTEGIAASWRPVQIRWHIPANSIASSGDSGPKRRSHACRFAKQYCGKVRRVVPLVSGKMQSLHGLADVSSRRRCS